MDTHLKLKPISVNNFEHVAAGNTDNLKYH